LGYDVYGVTSQLFRIPDPFLSVAYSPDGQVLLTGSDDGTIQQYNASTGELVKVFFFPVASIKPAALSIHLVVIGSLSEALKGLCIFGMLVHST
jgi:WD40 repeat protein